LRLPLDFAPAVDFTQAGPRRLLAMLDNVIAAFEQETSLAQEPLLVAQYEALLLTGLLACLPHNHVSQLAKTPAPAPHKIVGLVEAYIEANADRPLRLRDLADVTGVGVRSIQLAFQKHRGYSPSRFLRECRLARARQALRQANPETTILSVALLCGFASQSLFCRLYRERYGEKPSETMHRNAT